AGHAPWRVRTAAEAVAVVMLLAAWWLVARRDFPQGAGGELRKLLAPGIGGVPGKVMPQRAALALQHLFERPRRNGRQFDAERRLGRAAGGAEHVVLPGLAVVQQLLGGARRVGQLGHEAGAVFRQSIQRAGHDQGLNDPAVELARIDPPAEIREVDVAALLAAGDDGLAGAAADALDRAQPI